MGVAKKKSFKEIRVYSAYAEENYEVVAQMMQAAYPEFKFKRGCLVELAKAIMTEAAAALKTDDFLKSFLKALTPDLIEFARCQFSMSSQVATSVIFDVIFDAVKDYLAGKDPIQIVIGLIKKIWELSRNEPAPGGSGTISGPENNPVNRC